MFLLFQASFIINFRSLFKHIYLQLDNNRKGKTILSPFAECDGLNE